MYDSVFTLSLTSERHGFDLRQVRVLGNLGDAPRTNAGSSDQDSLFDDNSKD